MATIKIRFKDRIKYVITLVSNDFFILLSDVKQCVGRQYDPISKLWIMDWTKVNVERLWKYMPDADRMQIEKELKESKSQTDEFNFLYPFQKDGVHEMLNGKKMLCDDTGLGKTVTSMVYAKTKGYLKILVVCPSPLKRQWQEELLNYINEPSLVLEGSSDKRRRILASYNLGTIKYLITNYEQLRVNPDILKLDFDLVIFDEVHKIKNFMTKTHKAAKKLKTKDKIGLTATPFVNNPLELMTVSNFICPNFFNRADFLNRFVIFDRVWNGREMMTVPVGYRNLEELNKEMRKIMIRRKKHDVLDDLPPKTYQNYFIDMSSEQSKLFRHYFSEAKETYDQHEIKEKLLALLSMSRLVCDSTGLMNTSHSDLAIPVVNPESPKLDFLKELSERIEDKILIFTQWKSMAEIIHKEMGGFIITGDTPDKMEKINEFKHSNEKILVATDCLNYGANIQFVSTIVHFDLPWSPALIEQREGRIDRIGQKNRMLVVNLIMKDSVEERVYDILSKKRRMFNLTIEGTGGSFQENDIVRDLFTTP